MTLASPFMALLRRWEGAQVSHSRQTMAERESCSFSLGPGVHGHAWGTRWTVQAACWMPVTSIGTGKALPRSIREASRIAEAVSRQVPQVAPQPVRMVSSAMLRTPLAAASRIWWSVTPLQMQTYTARWIPGSPDGLGLFHRK